MRILDLDGPILDGRARHYACYSDILTGMRKTPLDIDQYWRLKRDGIPSRDILAYSDAGDLIDDFAAHWRDLIETPSYLALDRLQDGAAEKLAQWDDCILITMRQDAQAVHRQLKLLRIHNCFRDIIVVSEGDKTGKIIPAAGAIWIGDTEADALAAQAANVRCYLVENGLRSRDYLSRLPGTIIPSIREAP